jgi:hypothetical protein
MVVSLIPNPIDHRATYARVSRCINYIFGSFSLIEHVSAAGINSFYETPYHLSDNRGLFIDIQELPVFSAILSTIMPPPNRKLVSTSQSLIKKFITALENQQCIPQLLSNIQHLATMQDWTPHHHQELERIDD